MKVLNRIFTIIFLVVFTTMNSFAAQNCSDKNYRRAYPERCKTTNSRTFLSLAGGAALVGAGVAFATQTKGSHNSSPSVSNQTTFNRTTLSANIITNYAPTDYVNNQRINAEYLESLTDGDDIDSATINSIKSSDKYIRNYRQYNAIKFAWANARDFTGKNTSVSIVDNFISNHGDTVYEILSNIAPDTTIAKQNIANDAQNFKSYDYIANTMNQSAPANIYNASWQITNISAADVIYNNSNMPKTYAMAQEYLYNITSENFINQIRNLAADNDAIFVWAAGNESNSESGALSALPIAFPDLNGHFVNVVALDNSYNLAWYSNQCGVTQNYCIAAPGTAWKTDTQGYASGTSFATPVVSGAIATIKEAFPYMNASEITALLFTTATDLGETGIDEVYGWGLLNMEKATQPVGTPRIVLSNKNIQPLSGTNIGGPAATAIQKANIKIAFIDDFGRAFTTNLSDNIKVIPYGRGFDKLRENEKDSVVLFDTFELGFKQNHLLESSGLISVQQNQLTNFVGYKNEFEINNVKFYQKARFGVTHPTAEDNSIVSGFSNIYTSSLAFGTNWQDLSFEIAIPETIISGDMYATVPVARANNGQIIYNTTNIDLSSTKPSTEYTVGYKNLSATYVNNPDYENEFFIMAKTKFAF